MIRVFRRALLRHGFGRFDYESEAQIKRNRRAHLLGLPLLVGFDLGQNSARDGPKCLRMEFAHTLSFD